MSKEKKKHIKYHIEIEKMYLEIEKVPYHMRLVWQFLHHKSLKI